jgi:hypothetical protein
MATRTRTTEITPGSGTEYTEWGLNQMQDLINQGYDPYEGPNPYGGGLNFLQQSQVDNMNELEDLYGGPDGYWKKSQDIYGDVGAMSPEEVEAMSRSGGPADGYFDPYRDKMKGYMKEDYTRALSDFENEVGAGAAGKNAFGGSRHGVASGVGGAKAMDDYLRAATAMDSQAYENAMQWQREDYQDDISRVKYANEANMGFGDMRTRAATSMRDISQPLSLITEQTAAGDKLRGYDAAADMWDQELYDKEQSWKTDRLNEYMQGVSGGQWPQTTTQTQTGGQSQGEKNMGYAAIFFAKVISKCIPEGTKIDTPDGPVAIEDIKAGTKVKGYYKAETEVLQVHQYKEDRAPHRFYHIRFDNGGAVDCCDMHKIYNKRAKDYKVGDRIQNTKITSITRYNGVERSYDLLTADGGYLIGGVPVNSMIEELASLANELKQVA